MKKLLITGFDPFGGETVNPSWEAVKRLPDVIGQISLTKLEIPTVFGLAAQKVMQQAELLQPDVILCVGQAGGRSGITPEVVGINLRDARIPDNADFRPDNEPVIPGGPAAYFATVPVREMVAAMTEAGFPAARSLSAGAFVCNDTLYTLLHRYDGTPVRVGFIHVPFLPSQAKEGVPSMEPDDIVRALTAAIGCL
jgi:pyroglutamyl-peptidase